MKLLLSISLFLAAVIDSHARVSNDFYNCLDFFYKRQIPNGFQGIAKADLFDRNNLPDGIDVNVLSSPAYICQTYDSVPQYATLYDRGRLMPLYSAYIMNPVANQAQTGCNRPRGFMLEPQLVYRGVNENMMKILDAKKELGNYNKQHKISEREEKNRLTFLLKTSQAHENGDYSKGYDKGHLNPCGHQTANETGYKATFTLTNTVPMAPKLNENTWCQYEEKMNNMSPQCTRMYVITGIVPGNVPIKDSRLAAPTHVWNAYCCVDNNGKPIKSGAGLAENKDESALTEYDDICTFQCELKTLLGDSHNIELFEGDCNPQKVSVSGAKEPGCYCSII